MEDTKTTYLTLRVSSELSHKISALNDLNNRSEYIRRVLHKHCSERLKTPVMGKKQHANNWRNKD